MATIGALCVPLNSIVDFCQPAGKIRDCRSVNAKDENSIGFFMKKQNFYPKQVLRAMAGKDVETLDAAQRHALRFFMLRSRKYGIPVSAVQTTSVKDLRLESMSDLKMKATDILANGKTRIFLKPANGRATLDSKTAV